MKVRFNQEVSVFGSSGVTPRYSSRQKSWNWLKSIVPFSEPAISFSNIPTGVLPVGREIGAVGRSLSTPATISAAIALIWSAFFTTTSAGSCTIPKPSPPESSTVQQGIIPCDTRWPAVVPPFFVKDSKPQSHVDSHQHCHRPRTDR